MTEQEIIDKAVEKALLLLPEVVSRLFMEKVAMKQMAEKFFSENPTFQDNKEIVATTLGELECNNPGKPYSEVLQESIPIIKQRIAQGSSLNMSEIKKPSDLNYHGEL